MSTLICSGDASRARMAVRGKANTVTADPNTDSVCAPHRRLNAAVRQISELKNERNRWAMADNGVVPVDRVKRPSPTDGSSKR